MSVARFSASLIGVIGLLAAMVSGSIVWLLITDPVQVADAAKAASSGDMTPIVQAIGAVLIDALRGLFRFL
jgi:hypothetical protein